MQTFFIWSKYDLHHQGTSVDSTVTSLKCNKIFSLLQIKTMLFPVSQVIKTLTTYEHMFTQIRLRFGFAGHFARL